MYAFKTHIVDRVGAVRQYEPDGEMKGGNYASGSGGSE